MSKEEVPLEDQVEVLRIMDEELLTSDYRWTQGMDFRPGSVGGAYCLRGARREAVHLHQVRKALPAGYQTSASLALNLAVQERLIDCVREVTGEAIPEVNFNDRPSRIFEDIKSVIRCAREKASS